MWLWWHPNQKTLPSLYGLTSLRDLTIESTGGSYSDRALKQEALSSLISLGALELRNIPVEDLSGLENLTRVECIYLLGLHCLTCLPPLKNLERSSLHVLEVWGINMNCLEGLNELKLLIRHKLEGLAARGELVPHTPSKTCDAAKEKFLVFLIHRGPDMTGGFVTDLYHAISSARLSPFLDNISVVKGSDVFSSIDDALEVAKVHVAVVSRGFAESIYCLSQLVAMMGSRKPVIPVLYGVEPADLRQVENGPFAAAFQKHKYMQTPERVEGWAYALRELAGIKGICFGLSDYKRDKAELKQEVVDAVTSLVVDVVTGLIQ